MVIRILDHISSYSSYSDGEVIYRLIEREFESKRDVTLSFQGIKSISSAFANSALIRLVEKFAFEDIRARLHIVDSTRQINRLVKDRFAFAVASKNTVNEGARPST